MQCQTLKLADGLLSGRYSAPGGEETWQEGLKPSALKKLVGKGHAEFEGMKQQGASQLLRFVKERQGSRSLER